MPLAAPIKNSFNAGEFSPLVFGRTDFNKYANGTALMQNFIPQVQGGMTRRVGSLYVNPTRLNEQARLVRFVFSNGDAFMLEFGDFYMRFYRNRAQVNVTGAAAYNGATAYVKGEYVTYASLQYMALRATTGDQPDISPLDWRQQDAYEIETPYALADVPFLRFQQSRDVLYIAHPSYAPRKLTRSALTSWAFSTVSFTDGPYLQINNTATTLTPAATSGSGVNVTASSIVGINDGTGFQTTDVGRQIRIQHGTTWGWATITGRTSTTVVVVTINSAFGATTASANFRLGEWSDTTLYPSLVFLFEDRLGWAASPVAPTTMNLSQTGDYENMAQTSTASVIAANNALQIRINAREQDPIRWVIDDEKGLLAGTKGGEYVVRASINGEAMSAINFPSARRATKHGSANVEPVEAGKAVLFAQTAKRKIREMAYVYEVDGFRAPDLTLLAEHATKGNIAQMAYQQEPFSIVWTRLETGALWGMTYDREQDVVGWHRHTVGGYYDSGATVSAKVESIACIPSPTGDQDDLWMIVARYIDGGIKRYVEYLSPFNADYDAVKDCYFVDGGKVIDLGSVTTAVTGLTHLKGQTVSLLVDGSPQPNQVVSSAGELTLTRAGQYVMVGLPFVSRSRLLRPDAGAANGTAQGKIKRTHRLAARFHQTVGVKIGRDFTENGAVMDAIDFRPGNHAMGQPVPMFSGDKPLEFEDDYTTDGYLCFEQVQPLPCTILAVMPHTVTQDAG
jgi:hypothetical protein